jgi:predicted phage terminase large subunit-like protein
MPALAADVERLARRVVWVKETVARSPYVPHDPTPRQSAFLALDCEEAGYGGSAGSGKAVCLSTPLPCADGSWTTMGDVHVGDVLLDEHGHPTAKVLSVSQVMTEHACLRIEFSDGSDVVADAEHDWPVTWTTGDAALRGLASTTGLRSLLRYGSVTVGAADRARRVTRVEQTTSVPVRCIAVDSPSRLYLAGRSMVPTHNSDALLMDALLYVDQPDYAGLLIRRTFAELALPGALMDRAAEWLGGKGCKWDSETHTWRFPSGATLTFGHMETTGSRSRYQSSEFSYIGVDEAVLLREADYLFLFSRLRRKAGSMIPGRMRSATNPPTLEYVGSDWYERRFSPERPQPHRPFVKATLWDNPHIDQADYVSKLNRLDPVTRERLLHGNWKIRAAGKLFNRAWFPVTETVPRIGFRRQVRWWDTAATEKPDEMTLILTGKKPREPDWTVGLLLAQDHQEHCYIVDVVRGQWAPGAVVDVIVNTAILDGRDVSIRWGEEGGSAGKIVSAALRRRLRGYDAKGIKETGDKEVRAHPVSAAASHGEISVVSGPWYEEFMRVVEAFPAGPHDDDVDALSGAYSQIAFRADVGDLDEVNRDLGRPTGLLDRRPV